MTLRERIADWISGGAVTQSCDQAARAWEADTGQFLLFRRRERALRDIAAMETPNANATVKRMARTAREALK